VPGEGLPLVARLVGCFFLVLALVVFLLMWSWLVLHGIGF
jgi:hypothetical protein